MADLKQRIEQECPKLGHQSTKALPRLYPRKALHTQWQERAGVGSPLACGSVKGSRGTG